MPPLVRISASMPLNLSVFFFFLFPTTVVVSPLLIIKGDSSNTPASLRVSSSSRSISSVSISISFPLVRPSYRIPFSVPIATLDGIIHSSNNSYTTENRSSFVTNYGNECHVLVRAFIGFTLALWKSSLKSAM